MMIFLQREEYDEKKIGSPKLVTTTAAPQELMVVTCHLSLSLSLDMCRKSLGFHGKLFASEMEQLRVTKFFANDISKGTLAMIFSSVSQSQRCGFYHRNVIMVLLMAAILHHLGFWDVKKL